MTTDSDHWLLKPRPVIWEYLFLDGESPLRLVLGDILDTSWLPDLHVDPETSFFNNARVQKLRVDPIGNLSRSEREKVGIHIGILSACALWFGIGDLHCDNVIVGRLDGRIVLAPIDLECVFRKYPLISSTLLLPKRDAHSLHCGLAEFVKLNALDLAVHASVSFVESMRRLQAGAARLGQVISKECEKATLYSRVVLRPTAFYSNGLQAGEKGADTDLLPSELEQLNRGDIPYYFRDISSDELRYFTAPGKPSPWDDVRERYSHVRHSLRIVSPDDPASVGCVDDRSVQASCLEILHKLGGSGRESFSEQVGAFAIHKTSKLYRMESGEFEARGFYRT